jgi:hypothetical protein
MDIPLHEPVRCFFPTATAKAEREPLQFDMKRLTAARGEIEQIDSIASMCDTAGTVLGLVIALKRRGGSVFHIAKGGTVQFPVRDLRLGDEGIEMPDGDGGVLVLPYTGLAGWFRNHSYHGAAFMFDVNEEPHVLAPSSPHGDETYAFGVSCATIAASIDEDDMISIRDLGGNYTDLGGRIASISPPTGPEEVPGPDHVLNVAGVRIRIGSITAMDSDQEGGVYQWYVATSDGAFHEISYGELDR